MESEAKPDLGFEMETVAGQHISTTSKMAVECANERQERVLFRFNGVQVAVEPGESAEAVEARWQQHMDAADEAYRSDPQRKVEAAERAAREKAEREAVMLDRSRDQQAMRDAKVPWPKTEQQLLEYIGSLVDRPHDYGTAVYAMSMAATAAFHYVAGLVGASGFQASFADLDMVRRTRSITGPFMLLRGEDALYPQYDLPKRLAEAMQEWKPWLKEEAKKKLAEGGAVHPDVRRHWAQLAAMEVTS